MTRLAGGRGRKIARSFGADPCPVYRQILAGSDMSPAARCLLADPDALVEPDRLRANCRFACAVAALTTTERGAIPALPTRAVVERFLTGVPDALCLPCCN